MPGKAKSNLKVFTLPFEDYRLAYDDQWIIERRHVPEKGKLAGEEMWKQVSFHSRLVDALSRVAEWIGTEEAAGGTLAELQASMERCYARLEAALELGKGAA